MQEKMSRTNFFQSLLSNTAAFVEVPGGAIGYTSEIDFKQYCGIYRI